MIIQTKTEIGRMNVLFSQNMEQEEMTEEMSKMMPRQEKMTKEMCRNIFI